MSYDDNDLFLVDLDLYHSPWRDVEGRDLATGKSRRAFEELAGKFPKYMFEEQKCVDVAVPIAGRVTFKAIDKAEAAVLARHHALSGTGLADVVYGMSSAHGHMSSSYDEYEAYKKLHDDELRRIGL